MRAVIIFICCTGFALVCAGPQDKYTSKYDNINIDSILNNPRILRNYIQCLLDKGPCTNEGRELKGEFFLFCIHILYDFSNSSL